MAKILIICDIDEKRQLNGVVTVYNNLINELIKLGQDVKLISFSNSIFKTISMPTYKENKWVLNPWKMNKMIEAFKPDHIHIATESALGLYASFFCRKKKYAFTSAYHTQVPLYINMRFPFISQQVVYGYMKMLHQGSKAILVCSPSIKDELISQKFNQEIKIWDKAADDKIFYPTQRENHSDKEKILLYVGRIAPEKNIPAFLDLPNPGKKIVIGEGPLLKQYQKTYKNNQNIVFIGSRTGEELRQFYNTADVLVFPSKTDTYGLVILEAMACGTPVAAYPATGAKDLIKQGISGYMHDDLSIACQKALLLDRKEVITHARQHSWQNCTKMFLNFLHHVAG
jgi:glycosyltransferase involved in cell wall biosynthesis